MKEITSPVIEHVENHLPDDPKLYWRRRQTVYDGVEDCVNILNKGVDSINNNNDKLQEFVNDVNDNEHERIEKEEERIRNEQERIKFANRKVEEAIGQAGSKEIIDHSVSKDKLSHDVLDTFDSLQDQINDIVVGNLSMTLTATTPIFVNKSTQINLKAVVNIIADEIKITGGNMTPGVNANVSELAATDTLNVSSAGTTIYTADFIIKGIKKSKTATVTAVNKIYYGGANAYTDLTTDTHALTNPKTSPNGNYSMQVATTGMKLYWIVPSSMSINKALIDNNPLGEVPLTMSTATIGGVSYKVYESVNQITAGIYNITVS